MLKFILLFVFTISLLFLYNFISSKKFTNHLFGEQIQVKIVSYDSIEMNKFHYKYLYQVNYKDKNKVFFNTITFKGQVKSKCKVNQSINVNKYNGKLTFRLTFIDYFMFLLLLLVKITVSYIFINLYILRTIK